jgi:O-acetyl-ADP-ribose deacetylase (regulator of RNase III)
MLKHTKGNLIDLAEQGKFDVIVHGCNCQNTMGSGIAAEIRMRYPDAYEADTRMDKEYGVEYRRYKLGKFTTSPIAYGNREFTIVNAYTQINFLPRGVDHFEYDSFSRILNKLLVYYGDKNIGFPYIGMGLAGGDKDRIIKMLEDFAEQVSMKNGSVTLVEFG